MFIEKTEICNFADDNAIYDWRRLIKYFRESKA